MANAVMVGEHRPQPWSEIKLLNEIPNGEYVAQVTKIRKEGEKAGKKSCAYITLYLKGVPTEVAKTVMDPTRCLTLSETPFTIADSFGVALKDGQVVDVHAI